MKPHLVLCSGAKTPSNTSIENEQNVIRLDMHSSIPSTYLRISNVAKDFAQNLSPRFLDLLEIATYVYAADCDTINSLDHDFHFVIPVREIDFWKDLGVSRHLTDALYFISGYKFKFEFIQLSLPTNTESYFEIGSEDYTPFYGIDHVTMFSGGIDSLAGATETASDDEPLVLISHRPTPSSNEYVDDLYANLKSTYKSPMIHIPVWVNKSVANNESFTRTHSFLLSALGASIASALKIRGIKFYANGVSSLNWQQVNERQDSRAPRATHPRTLYLLQVFYRLVSEIPNFTVDNPYEFNTKSKVLEIIEKNQATKLIGVTRSCESTGLLSGSHTHCGLCRHCIDRRIAVLYSGLEGSDPNENYASDVFRGARSLTPKGSSDHDIAVSFLRFAYEVVRMSEPDIGNRYNTELNLAVGCYSNVSEVTQRFREMHHKHFTAVKEAYSIQIRDCKEIFFSSDLAKTSLLRVIGSGEHIGLPAPTFDPPYDSLPETEDAPSNASKYVFKQNGRQRKVSINSELISVNDYKGMHYIHYLLDHPNVDVDISYLAAITPTKSETTNILQPVDIDYDEWQKINWISGRSKQDKLEEGKLNKAYRKAIREKNDDINEAVDEDDKEVLQNQLEELEIFFRSKFNKYNLLRQNYKELKNARDRVKAAINRAYAEIGLFDKDISNFLEVHITFNPPYYKYYHEPPIDWDL